MKPQSLALAEHLNSGGDVTRDTAFRDFSIQNLTARLSELTSVGFDLVKTPFKVLDDRGRKLRITAWKFRDPIIPGCTVRVVRDIGTMVALKGRVGRVERIDLRRALATIHIEGVGYRSLKFNALKRLPHIAAGTSVSIKLAPYVVMAYHPEVRSYTITSANPEHTIVAHENLVEAHAS